MKLLPPQCTLPSVNKCKTKLVSALCYETIFAQFTASRNLQVLTVVAVFLDLTSCSLASDCVTLHLKNSVALILLFIKYTVLQCLQLPLLAIKFPSLNKPKWRLRLQKSM